MCKPLTFIFLAVLSLTVISCLGNHGSRTIPKDFGMQNTEVRDKIPLRAGIYLSPGFKKFSYKDVYLRGALGQEFYALISMGDALEGGSILALKNIFKEVVLIDGMDPEPLKEKIDVVVTPEVVKVEVKLLYVGINERAVRASIKWSIVSVEGKEIYVNTVTGEGSYKLPLWLGGKDAPVEAAVPGYIRALQDHFLKAQDDIYSNKWWAKQWWKEGVTKPAGAN
ncbi:MAG: hypothetical protein HZA12_06535 [Nitrospirae bacterium]|nr:hypothetical protein [Nitrospirota bacterium]